MKGFIGHVRQLWNYSRFLRTCRRCGVPPRGWRCSRPKGHVGPCAATPVGIRRLIYILKGW